MRIWGCPFEVRIYNPQEKKLGPRTISGYFIGYAEKSKGYILYCPSHTTRIMESRNTKFLENDLGNWNGQFHDALSEKYHHQSQVPGPKDGNFGFDGYIGTWILRIYRIYIGGYFYMNIDISKINKITLKFMEILSKSVKMTLIIKYIH